MGFVEKRKVVLVGTGFVGMSMAYSMLSDAGIDELVLIDVVKEKAQGEAMDLSHGLPYCHSKAKIKAGDYSDCKDASVVVITAGAAQKPGQTRLELTAINTKIMKGICEEIKATGFSGILVIASNPVDIMSYVALKVTGLPASQVIGTGTLLDSARLRYMIGEYFDVNTNNVHAYIMGEHGDSSFVPWIHSYIGCKSILEYLDEKGKDLSDLLQIYENVKNAAYEIIERKKATYYGIGLALKRLVFAILNNENAVMTVSTLQENQYGHEDLYIGVPCIINKEGIKEVIKLPLNEVDQAKFDRSCNQLKDTIKKIVKPIIK